MTSDVRKSDNMPLCGPAISRACCVARELLRARGVPSFDHEFLVDLFRNRGELAAELLRINAGIVVEHARIEHGSIDLSQVASTEYRADAVVVLRDRDDRAVTGVVVEVQRGIDGDKLLSWPVYVTTLRAKHACAVVLLVIAPDRSVAAWARRPIEIGHPGFRLTPVVVGFDDVPRVRDRADAHRLPELAVLSAIAHPELEVAELAVDAIRGLSGDRMALYCDVVLSAVPEMIREALEAKMQDYKYKSEFALKYYGQGEAAGLEKGLEQGLQMQAAAFALARDRLKTLTDDEHRAIEAIRDPRVLIELITALRAAATAAETRVAIDRAIDREGRSTPFAGSSTT